MDESQNDEGFKPPYFSFQTFWTFLEEVVAKPLPPQIDRSMLGSKSGTDQANLLAALKAFGFVTANHGVPAGGLLERFQEADENGRKKILAEIVNQYYPKQLQVSDANGTDKLLLDSFEAAFGYTGDTRRKAETFFLHAARTAGFTLSEYFPKTRSGPGSSAGTGRKRTTRGKGKNAGASTEPENDPPPPPAKGDTYKVDLKAGGTVTLTVEVSHFALSKNREDRNFVNDLIDKLTDYGDVETTEGEAVEEPAPHPMGVEQN